MTTLITNLKEHALPTRFKLLSERLIRNLSRIYSEQSFNFEPRWFLIFYQLTIKSPMSITEIADAIGITHPAVNQMADEMIKAGIIKESIDTNDRRKRLLSLSDEGKKMLIALKPLWDDIGSATLELIHSVSSDFFFIIEGIEEALDKMDIYTRVKEKMKIRNNEK